MAQQQLTYRVAAPNDEAAILAIFAEVAAEVPTAVRPQTEDIIRDRVATGQSWVAVDSNGIVVGYALAERDAKEFAQNQIDAISLTYLGVTNAARGQHVCSTLVSKLKKNGVPITASVRHNNASSMADRFKHLGFVESEVREEETKFRWEKPPNS